MVVSALLVVLLGFVLFAVLQSSPLLRERRVTQVVFGGYILRLVLQLLTREVQFFSHKMGGGDAWAYEELGNLIAVLWQRTSLSYITADELPQIGPTSLPQNLFALIMYLNGGERARVGCTALVAFAAALTFVSLYTLAVELGAEKKRALAYVSILYFQPAFLFYTSDMYKDGLVLCFTVGALASAIRLASRFTVLHAVLGVVCLCALWYVRFYLLFVTVAPLAVGLVGIGSRSAARTVIAAGALIVAMAGLVAFTGILQAASERAAETYEMGTSWRALGANASGGSGVTFDDGGSPFGALHWKLLYTLFSPFPWSAGSFGFQIGKLDAFLWYFIVYRAYQARRYIDRRVLAMILTFLVPTLFMYSLTMANVGLIVRQRLVVVAAVTLLATLYRPEPVRVREKLGGRRAMRNASRVPVGARVEPQGSSR